MNVVECAFKCLLCGQEVRVFTAYTVFCYLVCFATNYVIMYFNVKCIECAPTRYVLYIENILVDHLGIFALNCGISLGPLAFKENNTERGTHPCGVPCTNANTYFIEIIDYGHQKPTPGQGFH